MGQLATGFETLKPLRAVDWWACGKWQPATGKTRNMVTPIDGRTQIGHVTLASADDMAEAVRGACLVAAQAHALDVSTRQKALLAMSEGLLDQKHELANLIEQAFRHSQKRFLARTYIKRMGWSW